MVILQVDKLRRYGYYLFQYIFQERLRGLDFTMRDRQLYQETAIMVTVKQMKRI